MPGFDKSPLELMARFDAVAARFPGMERRLTFGYPCLYVGGNMVSGLHESAWFVRLGGHDLGDALALAGARPFEPMPGRPMTGYTLLPPAVIDDDDAIEGWVQRAVDYGATLPPKVPKSKPKSRPKTG